MYAFRGAICEVLISWSVSVFTGHQLHLTQISVVLLFLSTQFYLFSFVLLNPQYICYITDGRDQISCPDIFEPYLMSNTNKFLFPLKQKLKKLTNQLNLP